MKPLKFGGWLIALGMLHASCGGEGGSGSPAGGLGGQGGFPG
ncbi:MAG TPA: hypothetical protein VFK05_29435 [Polyangiaceae bacterium]|nr:hypothetical protein [Polyangiaceae bacterium]